VILLDMRRRCLERLAEVIVVGLDALVLRLHTETACRRGGGLALRLQDVDPQRGLIRLREKGETLRWQPITLNQAARLLEHARRRGADRPEDQLLRYRNGRPRTSRRYDRLWARLGERLPGSPPKASPLTGCGTPP
jgi:hypothetical protein